MSLPKGAVNKVRSKANIMNTPFIMFQAHHDDYYDMSQESLNGMQEESILSKVFFHPNNIDLIQKLVIMEVFRRTNGAYLIEKQNLADIQIVMRSIFIQHAKHQPDHIKEQIRELDYLVADEVVPGVVSEVKAYFGYLERAFGPRQIMDHAENVSNKGQKILPSVSRRFGS